MNMLHSTGLLSGSVRLRSPLRQQILLRPANILRPRLRLGNGFASNKFSCQASAFDPDEYEHEDDVYDSDDYSALEKAAEAPRHASQASNPMSPPSASDTFSRQPENNKPWTPRSQFITSPSSSSSKGEAKDAITHSFNLLIFIGAAVDRFVSRMQAAIFAAGAAAWALLAKLAHAGGKNVQTAKLKASKTFKSSPAGKKLEQLSTNIDEVQKQLPDDVWGKLLWLWDRPPVQRLRLTISMANLSIRLPAILALVATQVGLLASQVSLPMLAPLLLGTGMLLRSVKSNASFLFPRIGILVVVFWLLWFANSVIQNTANYLRRQGAIDNRLAGGIITVSEVSALLVSMVVLLSMLGVNVSALLLPAGIAVAVACKDLSHNFLAGFFLFVVQPFRVGDRVAVSSSAPGTPGSVSGAWFEGVAEKVDLRYTMIRQGKRRLMVPNSAFITREFMVLEDAGVNDGMMNHNVVPSAPEMPSPYGTTSSNGGGTANYQQYHMTNDYRHVWQYVNGPPVHQELLHPDQQQQQQQPNGVNGSGTNGNNSSYTTTNGHSVTNGYNSNQHATIGTNGAPPPPPPPPSSSPSHSSHSSTSMSTHVPPASGAGVAHTSLAPPPPVQQQQQQQSQAYPAPVYDTVTVRGQGASGGNNGEMQPSGLGTINSTNGQRGGQGQGGGPYYYTSPPPPSQHSQQQQHLQQVENGLMESGQPSSYYQYNNQNQQLPHQTYYNSAMPPPAHQQNNNNYPQPNINGQQGQGVVKSHPLSTDTWSS